MTIRYAETADVKILLTYDKHISAAEIENSVMLHRVYIAETDGKFAGWMRYGMFWDNTPFMNMLYILPEYQHNEFGRKLVWFWEEQMKSSGHNLLLTSTVEKETAKYFYEKLGYKTIGGFTLPKDEYEIIMCKEI